MNEKKGKNRYIFLIIASIFILVFFLPHVADYLFGKNNPEPNFPGYGSNIIRLEPLNLTQIQQNAQSKGFKVHTYGQWDGTNRFEAPFFLDTGKFILEPQPDTNFTLYYFEYGSNDNGVLDEFWPKLGYYLNKSDSELESEKQYFNENNKDKPFLGKAIEGKPIWSRIISDHGIPVLNDTSGVGDVHYEFSSGTEMELKKFHLTISKSMIVDEQTVELIVSLDEDSDIRLVITCEEPLEEPIKLFQSLFDIIEISKLDQERFELQHLGLV